LLLSDNAEVCAFQVALTPESDRIAMFESQYGKITGTKTATKLKRLECEQYIARHIAKKEKRWEEAARLRRREVGGKDGETPYVSGYALESYEQTKEKQQEWIEKTGVKIGGKSIPLADCIPTPDAKKAELYKLNLEQQKRAESRGWGAVFVTFTCPPNMHPNPSKGINSWDGTTPDIAAKWLSKNWTLIRAQFAKKGIDYEGVWTKEAHKDATPHMHCLIYAEKEKLNEIINLCEFYGLPAKVDCKIIHEDEGAAKPASYIFKYITKNLDDSETATPEKAHQSLWGYRRYGFFGVKNSLTKWRLLRRRCEKADGLLAYIRDIAKDNNFASFLEAEENIEIVWENNKGRYGDEVKKAIGIRHMGDGSNVFFEHGELVKLQLFKVIQEEKPTTTPPRPKGPPTTTPPTNQ
jgi:hypothetical protein